MTNLDKQQLRETLPLWLQEHGYPLNRSFRCLNPNHPDHHPSMRYNPKTQTVHCFACSATYDIFQLVGQEEQIEDFSSQLKRVQQRYGIQQTPIFPYKEKQKNTAQDFTSFVKNGTESRTKAAFDWFASRGIPESLVKKYNFFLWERRAVLPVFQQGICISWAARALDDTTNPRYLNSSGGMGIWGFDKIFEQNNQPIAICEGIFDALSLELCGCSAIALCGSGRVGQFRDKLSKLPNSLPPFILAGDNDSAGQKMCEELKKGISSMGGCYSVLTLPDGYKDANAAWIKVPEQLQQAVDKAKAAVLSSVLQATKQYEQQSMAGMAAEFLGYLDRTSQQPVLTSGLAGLDNLLGGGLFPGLYVLGAPSSLGKTTLLLQIADSIAASGRDVLFFSLEMGQWELLAKSLCRMAGLEQTITVREILTNQLPREQLESLLMQYNQTAGKHLFVVVGESGFTPAQVLETARKHREHRGQSPVVIVDYLQILSPESPRLSDKQNTDHAVLCLKALSRDLDVPVLAASSFNRDSYSRTASMEAFKESGAVEYAADVLLALQMSEMGKEGFDLNKAKVASPRKEDLIVLKNRNGTPYGHISMNYYAAANLFEETKQKTTTLSAVPNRIGRRR